jgi:hypothetical protein
MLRWLVQDGETNLNARRGVHPYLKNLSALTKSGLDQPFWFGISHEAFRAFLSFANLEVGAINQSSLGNAVREILKTNLPSELKGQIRRILLDESLLESRFEIELLLQNSDDPSAVMPWEPLCEISAKGVEGVLQGIRSCWRNLFRSHVLSQLQAQGLSLESLNVSILIRVYQPELVRGKAFSYSPRCPWDRKHLVVAYDNGKDQSAYLIDRSTLHSTYYGKSSEDIDDSTKTLPQVRTADLNQLPASEKIKSVAEFLLNCEKKLDGALQIDWSLGIDQRLIIRHVRTFDRSPAGALLDPHFNTTARNVWDQTLLNWNPSALLKPLWFSLLPRNFRTLSIRYIGALGIKNKLSGEYEKVFRGFWGILRGRPYINLAALRCFLGMSEKHDLAEELEMIVPIWMKRYDREMREAWDLQWPELPRYSRSEVKEILRRQNRLLKKLPAQLQSWTDQMHALRESLVSGQSKDRSVSSMLEVFQSWERKYVPGLVPILLAELQYWNLQSWYYQGAQKPSMNLSWNSLENREPLRFEGGWLSRRHQEKMYEQMEMLGEIRPQYLSMLDDVYEKLRKFFELLGQKYQALGVLEKADDVFYLTFEEMVSFDEGRASTVSWSKLARIRKEEYQRYARDVKVPEIWMTTGIVGLAARFPSIIAIKERKNPLTDLVRPAKPPRPDLTPTRAIGQLDFIEDESFSMVTPRAVIGPNELSGDADAEVAFIDSILAREPANGIDV